MATTSRLMKALPILFAFALPLAAAEKPNIASEVSENAVFPVPIPGVNTACMTPNT